MAKENMFEDFSKMASGAFTALSGVREEVETRMKEQLEKLLARMDMVTREEFEAVKEMATNARAHQELLEARIAELEAAQKSASIAAGPSAESYKSKPTIDGGDQGPDNSFSNDEMPPV